MGWYRRTDQGWTIALHVQPGAKRTEVAGLHGDSLKVRVKAPPVDGKANEAILEFVATRLGVRKQAVRLAGGASSREKRVAVDAPEADCERLLSEAAD